MSTRPLSRFDLYTLCVQAPAQLARFLAAVHGGRPRVLREDFSGPAAICGAWTAQIEGGQAIAVDMDKEPLAHAPRSARIRLVRGDVLAAGDRADIIAALNFPLGYWHERRDLIAYLKVTRKRLRARGVFVADMYGGSSAFEESVTTRKFRGPAGERVVYEWEQIQADQLTGLVHNAIHFTVQSGRGPRAKVRRLRNAFVYHWRLWSIPELRDAMLEAGFARAEVYDRLGDAVDSDGRLYVRPMGGDDRLDASWVAYVVGRV